MANTDYGAIPLTLATAVSQKLNQKLGVTTGFKPSEWTDAINLLGRLPNKTVSGSICHFTDGVSLPLVNGKFGITAYQDGTGTPSPSNVRAIHGYTGMDIVRCGKNLFNVSDTSLIVNGHVDTAGKYTKSSGGTKSILFPCKPNTAYTVSKQAGGRFAIGCFDTIPSVNDVATQYIQDYSASSISFTTDANTHYFVAFIWREASDSVTFDTMVATVQIEYGLTATTFSQYTGTTYPLTWQNECFGGYIDYKRGKKVTTYWKIDLGSGTWTYHQASGNFTDYFDYTMPSGHNANVINGSTLLKGACECYNIVKSGSIAISETDAVISIAVNKRRIIICDTRYTDGDDLQEYLDGKVLVYELETPIEEDIILPIISVLDGENNIWNTCGESQVTYIASSAKTGINFSADVNSGWSATDATRTMMTITASGDAQIIFGKGATGITNCSNNHAYIKLIKNSTEIWTKTLPQNTTTKLDDIPEISLADGDQLKLVFGYASTHSNVNMHFNNGYLQIAGNADVKGLAGVSNTYFSLIGVS